MPWIFDSRTGQQYRPDGSLAGVGYAGGNCGKNPEGVNNPDMQDVHSIGPLPAGNYDIGAPVEGTHLGPFALPLTPHPGNEMYGRSAFYCHGDNSKEDQSASEGCNVQARNVREEMWASDDHVLTVVDGV